MSTTIKSTIVSLRRPLKLGDTVRLGLTGGKYKITRIEGLVLFGLLEGHPSKERCITFDYKRPAAPYLRVTHTDGKHIE